jgi:hypothetical protein
VRDIEAEMAAKGILLLPKPFDIDELLEMVRLALDAREHHPYFSGGQDPHRRDPTE